MPNDIPQWGIPVKARPDGRCRAEWRYRIEAAAAGFSPLIDGVDPTD